MAQGLGITFFAFGSAYWIPPPAEGGGGGIPGSCQWAWRLKLAAAPCGNLFGARGAGTLFRFSFCHDLRFRPLCRSLSGQEIQQLYHQLRCYGVLSQTVIDETISHWDMLDDGKVTFQEFAVLLNPFLHLDSPGGPGSRKQSASAAPRRQSVTLSNPACRRQSAANTSASGRQSASPTLVT